MNNVYYEKEVRYYSFYIKSGRLLFSYYPADKVLLIDKVPVNLSVPMAKKKNLANRAKLHMLISFIFKANQTEVNG